MALHKVRNVTILRTRGHGLRQRHPMLPEHWLNRQPGRRCRRPGRREADTVQGRPTLALAQACENQGEEWRARWLDRRLERRHRHWPRRREAGEAAQAQAPEGENQGEERQRGKSVEHIGYSHASVVNCILHQSPRPLVL